MRVRTVFWLNLRKLEVTLAGSCFLIAGEIIIMSDTTFHPESQSELLFQAHPAIFFCWFEWEMVTADSKDVSKKSQRNSISTARWIKLRQTA